MEKMSAPPEWTGVEGCAALVHVPLTAKYETLCIR
jgi:hypothetical protein